MTALRKAPVVDDLFERVQTAIFGRDVAAARALYPSFKATVESDPANAMFARALDALGTLAGVTVGVLANAARLADLAPGSASTFAQRHAADALALRSLAGDCDKLAGVIGDTRGEMRKLGAAAATLTTMGAIEATMRALGERLDRLATQPMPLPLRTMEAAGSA